MASYTKFSCFVEDAMEKVHNLGSDQLVVALTNSAPSASNTVLANITEIAYTNLSGVNPRNLTTSSSSQTAGLYKLILADLTLTCGATTLPTFRYVVIYNDTATNDPLIAYYDYGGPISLAPGETFTIDFDPTNGFIQLQ